MLRAVAALSAGVATVILAVVAMAALVLPEPGRGDSSPLTSAPEAVGDEDDRWAARIQVTGDREGTAQMGEGWSVAGDAETGFYLDQMVFDGLNIFPQPEDCPLEVVDVSLDRLALLLRVDCAVTDISGNDTITLDGYTNGDVYELLPSPSEETGGTLTLSGDISSELLVQPTAWYVSKSDPDDQAILTGSREAIERQGIGAGDAGFSFDAAGNLILSHLVGYSRDQVGYSFSPQPDDCTAAVGAGEEISSTVERLTVVVDCPSVTGDSFEEGHEPVTVSVSGTVTIDRMTVDITG